MFSCLSSVLMLGRWRRGEPSETMKTRTGPWRCQNNGREVVRAVTTFRAELPGHPGLIQGKTKFSCFSKLLSFWVSAIDS